MAVFLTRMGRILTHTAQRTAAGPAPCGGQQMCAFIEKEKKGIILIRYEGSGFLALSICFSANPLPGTISQFVTCLSLFLLSSTSYCSCYCSLFLLFIVIFSSYYFLFIFIVVLSLIVVIARFLLRSSITLAFIIDLPVFIILVLRPLIVSCY